MCVGAFPEGLEDLHEKKGRLKEAQELQELSEEGESRHPAPGCGGFGLWSSSAGIRMRNKKPVDQPLRQIAKTERRISEVAAHLPEKKHRCQVVGKDSNHREHDQRLTTTLVHRRPFEMSLRGHGLEHLAIDNPTTATQLVDEQRWNRTQLQIAGVKIRARLKDRFFLCALSFLLIPLNAETLLGLRAHRLGHPNRAVGQQAKIRFSFEVDRFNGQAAISRLTFIYPLLPERSRP
jgi:hypothetical protein